MSIQQKFDCFSGAIEKGLSRWWGVLIYVVLSVVFYFVWDWDGLDRWIYVSSVLLVILLVGGARRSNLAMHAKLDDIDERDDLNRIEELSEEEIERKRRD
jgi:low affinity Fe/Cu permease